MGRSRVPRSAAVTRWWRQHPAFQTAGRDSQIRRTGVVLMFPGGAIPVHTVTSPVTWNCSMVNAAHSCRRSWAACAWVDTRSECGSRKEEPSPRPAHSCWQRPISWIAFRAWRRRPASCVESASTCPSPRPHLTRCSASGASITRSIPGGDRGGCVRAAAGRAPPARPRATAWRT